MSLGAGSMVTLALHGLVAWCYLWYATGGSFRLRGETLDTYDLLADAFLAGQLHLRTAPHPALLATADPYDPEQHRGLALLDASLYNGRYYLYFGPVPALLRAGWKRLTGVAATESAMGALFGVAGCLGFWLLARALQSRVFPGVSDGWLNLAYLCFAIGGVGPYLQARPSIYHEAVVAGTAFTLLGFAFWVRALEKQETRAAGWRLALAGVLFGLGFGSRQTMLAYAASAGLVMLVAAALASSERRRSAVLQLAAFGVPVAGCLALLLWYNHARFDHVAEFGYRYQLTGLKAAVLTIDARVIPRNAWAYALWVPLFLPFYPFQVSHTWSEWLGAQGAAWTMEASFASVLLLAPLAGLAPLAAWLLSPARGTAWPVRAFVVAGGIGVLATLGLVLCLRWVAGRHAHDWLAVATILGSVGLWRLVVASGSRPLARLGCRVLGAVLLLTSVAMGLTLGFNELNIRNPKRAIPVAYAFDSVQAAVLEGTAPGGWQARYLAEDVRRRPFAEGGAQEPERRLPGLFYLDGSTVSLPAPSGGPIARLEMDSAFRSPTQVTAEIGGRAFDTVARPGRHALCLGEPISAGPSSDVAVRLHFPNVPRPGSTLWPIRLRGVSAAPMDDARQVQWSDGTASVEVDLCNHVVSWLIRDRAVGQIFAAIDGGPEQFFGQAAEAAYEAPWIAGVKQVVFRVYAGTDHRRVIATSTLSR